MFAIFTCSQYLRGGPKYNFFGYRDHSKTVEMSEYLRQYLGNTRRGDGSHKGNSQQIRFKTSFHNTVYDVLRFRGYRETDGELDWDLYWCDKEWIHDNLDHIHLQPHQRVNHFRNHFELTRKDLLVKHIKRQKKNCEKNGLHQEAEAYARVTPTTFVLPQEYSMFVEEFKKSTAPAPPSSVGGKVGKIGEETSESKKKKSIWIMKPIGKAQGRGIFLIDSLKQVADWKPEGGTTRASVPTSQTAAQKNCEETERKEPETYVVQRYVQNPLLIGGKKFDLRLYVLVPSFNPLVAYLYRSGFARFSGSRFSMKSADLWDMGIHLTNVAVQKQQESYDERRGGKWELQNLKSFLYTAYGREKIQQMFCDIQGIILRCLFSVQSAIINDKHCFELYGFDVLIDADLKPWLLEVNSSPSLTATTREDYELKFGLLDDCVSVLDFERHFNGNYEEQVGGFDLIYKGGVRIEPPRNALYKTYLGCLNDRRAQLKRLARALAARMQQQKSASLNADTDGNAGKAEDKKLKDVAAGKRGSGVGGVITGNANSGVTTGFSGSTRRRVNT